MIEDTPKEHISLRRLVKDLKRHRALFTRENYVCYDGTPYDYEAVLKARLIKNSGNWGQVEWVGPRGGPQDDALSESLHIQFDKLAGVDPTKRSREDRLPSRLSQPSRNGSTPAVLTNWWRGATLILLTRAGQARGRGSAT